MAKKLVLVPHNMKSRSAKALAEALSYKLGYKVYRVRPSSVRKRAAFYLSGGTDKLTQLNRFNSNEVEHPEFTTAKDAAEKWITEDKSTVICRKLLRSSEGKGIVVAETVDQLVRAPLYTKYVSKKEEYRVHVLDGEVISVQMKKKRRGFEDERNTKIRNLANGYVFCRDGIVEPDGLRQLATRAVSALGYRLGAVDIAHNVKKKKLVVLEVNANPGMQGQTLEDYANCISFAHTVGEL
jgi:glutathione synthase/RimK-type ligase-like ATP-grasp enzyme